MSAGTRRRRVSVQLGKRVGQHATTKPGIKGPKVLSQAFNRIRLKVRVFGSAKLFRPPKSTFVAPVQHTPRPVVVIEALELMRARVKRLTAKTRLGKAYGKATSKPKIFAPVVLSQSRYRKSMAKRIASHSRLYKPYGGIPAVIPPMTRRPYLRVYQ